MSTKKELEELKNVLKEYFNQNPASWRLSSGHVPRQFVKFIGCLRCEMTDEEAYMLSARNGY